VITQQAEGRLIDRPFELPTLEKGDRVVAQFTATGHGWASTEEQCGEFCKMKYDLSFDGAEPAGFMQWRDDCKENPTGNKQHGTWFEERNGWCPGAVNSGIYIDITDSLNLSASQHSMALDISVLSKKTGNYEPYTNLAGWLKKDPANLVVDLKVFVYPDAAVKAVRSSGKTCSRIDSALQGTSMTPVGDRWPHGEVPERSQSHRMSKRKGSEGLERIPNFLRGDGGEVASATDESGVVPESRGCVIDFEAASPWYLYTQIQQNALAEAAKTTWSTVFKQTLIQSDSKIQKISINRSSFPKQWGQVGLRTRLEQPGGGLDFDHWDRLASVGLIVDRPVVVPVAETPRDKWWWRSTWWFQSLMSIAVLLPFFAIITTFCKWPSFEESQKDALTVESNVVQAARLAKVQSVLQDTLSADK